MFSNNLRIGKQANIKAACCYPEIPLPYRKMPWQRYIILTEGSSSNGPRVVKENQKTPRASERSNLKEYYFVVKINVFPNFSGLINEFGAHAKSNSRRDIVIAYIKIRTNITKPNLL